MGAADSDPAGGEIPVMRFPAVVYGFAFLCLGSSVELSTAKENSLNNRSHEHRHAQMRGGAYVCVIQHRKKQ